MKKQPHEPSQNPFEGMKKCGAKTRKGTPCQRIGTKRNGRCRLHGGAKGVGAPKGNTNALKHGQYTKEAIQERKQLRAVLLDARKRLDDL